VACGNSELRHWGGEASFEMAVDFSLLPTEDTEAVARPSKVRWAILSFTIAAVLAVGVLLLWPAHLPTNTLKFWLTLTIFPMGIPLFVVMRRYSIFEGKRLDAEMQRDCAHEYNEVVFAAASRPFIVIGSTLRFTAERQVNTGSAVQSGSVNLTTRDAIASDSEPVKARWIDVPKVKPDFEGGDIVRQVAVTRWLYSEILADVAQAIRTLPSRAEVEVNLWFDGELARDAYMALWQECWADQRLPSFMHIADERLPSGIEILDDWMDRMIAGESTQVARLVVAIQLHPVIANSPPTGTSEAGTALLLAPDAMAGKHALEACASLHRPMRGDTDAPKAMLANALKWANVKAEEISSGWITGLSVEQNGKLREAARQLGIKVAPTDVDQTVGYAGVASPWLALACAVDALSGQTSRQLIVTGERETMFAAVVRRDAKTDVTQDFDQTQAAALTRTL